MPTVLHAGFINLNATLHTGVLPFTPTPGATMYLGIGMRSTMTTEPDGYVALGDLISPIAPGHQNYKCRWWSRLTQEGDTGTITLTEVGSNDSRAVYIEIADGEEATLYDETNVLGDNPPVMTWGSVDAPGAGIVVGGGVIADNVDVAMGLSPVSPSVEGADAVGSTRVPMWMDYQEVEDAGTYEVENNLDSHAGIVRGYGGAAFFVAGVTAPPEPGIDLEVYDDDGILLGTIANAYDKVIRVELKGAGSGGFKLRRDDDQADLIAMGRSVRVTIPRISADPIFRFLIEYVETTVADADEDGGEVMVVSGRGALAYLDRAITWSESFVVPGGPDLDGVILGTASTGDKVGQRLWRTMEEWQHEDRPQQPIPLATYDFTQTEDSDGNVWTSSDMSDTAIAIGTRGMVLMGIYWGTGLIDIIMGPEFDLHAYNNFGRDLTGGAFGPGVVRFEKGHNVADTLKRTRGTPPATDILVRGDSVYANSSIATTTPVVEEFLQTSGVDAGALEDVGQAALLDGLRVSQSIAFNAEIPFEEPDEDEGHYLPGPEGSNGQYWIGDTVSLFSGSGVDDFAGDDGRIQAIVIWSTDAADIRAKVEVNATTIRGRGVGTGGRGNWGLDSGPSSGGNVGPIPPPPAPPAADLSRHVNDGLDAHNAAAISIQDGDGYYDAVNAEDAFKESAEDLADHAADTGLHGGSIEVADGTTSVDPTSLLSFDPAFFAVSDEGSDEALVTFIGEAGGGGGGTAFIGAQVHASANQSVNNGNLLFDSESFDTDGFHDTGSNTDRLTVPPGLGGKYAVFASTGITTANVFDVRFFVNGSQQRLFAQESNHAFTGVRSISGIVDLAAGDYVTVNVNTAGSARTMYGLSGGFASQFSIFKLGSGGRGDAVGAKAYSNATQSLSNATDTGLTLNAEDFDSDGFHDNSTNNSRFTVPSSLGGRYLLVGSAFFATTGGLQTLRWRKNGSTELGGESRLRADATSHQALATSVVADLVAGDYVELVGHQDSGGAANVGHATLRNIQTTGAVVRLDSGGLSIHSARAKRTSGQITLNSTSWANVDTGLDLTVAASVGDVLDITLQGLLGAQNVAVGLDVVSVVSGSPVNSVSASGASDYGFYYGAASTAIDVLIAGRIQYVVQTGDVSSGTVTLRLRYKTSAATNRTLYAGTGGNPQFNWSVANLGA